jgi:hypothetical protein
VIRCIDSRPNVKPGDPTILTGQLGPHPELPGQMRYIALVVAKGDDEGPIHVVTQDGYSVNTAHPRIKDWQPTSPPSCDCLQPNCAFAAYAAESINGR